MARRPVIFELTMPEMEPGWFRPSMLAMAMAPMLEDAKSSLRIPGVTVDESYVPVPLRSRVQPGFGVMADPTFCIRGEIEEGMEAELEADPRIAKVWSDCPIQPFPAPGCDPETAEGTLGEVAQFVGADKLWQKRHEGEGIVVGICDYGVSAQELEDKVIGGWTPESAPSNKYPPGKPRHWHGTMVASDFLGICPKAQVYDIGVLKARYREFRPYLSDAMDAFEWAIKQFEKDGTPQILCNSWGIYRKSWAPDYALEPDHSFTTKVLDAIEAGIIVAFAAGNCGQACPDRRCGGDVGRGKSIWGANGHPQVITFGAVNVRGERLGYSSQGPAALADEKPDLCGVGHFQGYCDRYREKGKPDLGTSAANPVGAGVIGLLKSAFPDLTPAEALQVLRDTARPLGDGRWNPDTGAGVVDAWAAFQSLRDARSGRADSG
jgi:serine protease AprX